MAPRPVHSLLSKGNLFLCHANLAESPPTSTAGKELSEQDQDIGVFLQQYLHTCFPFRPMSDLRGDSGQPRRTAKMLTQIPSTLATIPDTLQEIILNQKKNVYKDKHRNLVALFFISIFVS